VNDPSAYVAVDPAAILALQPASLPPLAVDPETAGDPRLPADHPAWQRDVLSISARARAIIAQIVPTVVRTLSYWDHRARELVLGARTLAVDPAGCYRLR
jgi:hypothetical protein